MWDAGITDSSFTCNTRPLGLSSETLQWHTLARAPSFIFSLVSQGQECLAAGTLGSKGQTPTGNLLEVSQTQGQSAVHGLLGGDIEEATGRAGVQLGPVIEGTRPALAGAFHSAPLEFSHPL